jgi:hypothetical protein
MTLEAAQLLSTAYIAGDRLGLYKPTHYNHPCAIWVRESIHNFNYLVRLFKALGDEYTYRYRRKHQSLELLPTFTSVTPDLPNVPMTPFKLAMPDEFKIKDDPVTSYRNYYVSKSKTVDMRWSPRSIPNWYVFNKHLVSL